MIKLKIGDFGGGSGGGAKKICVIIMPLRDLTCKIPAELGIPS